MTNRENEAIAMSNQELQDKCDLISKRCEHWESCQDGSHGLAMYNAGFFVYYNELKLREIISEPK